MKSNWLPKAMALFIAFSLWIFVMNELNPPFEAIYNVPLQKVNLKESLTVHGLPEMVVVKIRAPRTVLNNLKLNDIKAYVDLKGMTDGRYSMPVKSGAPQTVNIVDLQPNTVVFQIQSPH